MGPVFLINTKLSLYLGLRHFDCRCCRLGEKIHKQAKHHSAFAFISYLSTVIGLKQPYGHAKET
jgi:hypothetical protein